VKLVSGGDPFREVAGQAYRVLPAIGRSAVIRGAPDHRSRPGQPLDGRLLRGHNHPVCSETARR